MAGMKTTVPMGSNCLKRSAQVSSLISRFRSGKKRPMTTTATAPMGRLMKKHHRPGHLVGEERRRGGGRPRMRCRTCCR